jgi:hypothetical protein
MTDPTPLSDDEIDLAASLAIDGQELRDQPMSDADRVRVEARMAELRPAVAAVGEPVTPPSSETRIGHIEAALAAATEPSTLSSPSPARRARRRRARAVAPWAAAAAAAVLVVVVLASLAGRGSHNTAATSAGFQPVAGTAQGVSTTTLPVSSQSRDYASAGGFGSLDNLGSVATVEGLDALARHALNGKTGSTGTATGLSTDTSGSNPPTASTSTTSPALSESANSPIESCVQAAGSPAPAVGRVLLQARATVGTRPVLVVVYEAAGTSDGPRHLVVFEMPSCRVLVDRRL